jgi:hypothetical protein
MGQGMHETVDPLIHLLVSMFSVFGDEGDFIRVSLSIMVDHVLQRMMHFVSLAAKWTVCRTALSPAPHPVSGPLPFDEGLGLAIASA